MHKSYRIHLISRAGHKLHTRRRTLENRMHFEQRTYQFGTSSELRKEQRGDLAVGCDLVDVNVSRTFAAHNQIEVFREERKVVEMVGFVKFVLRANKLERDGPDIHGDSETLTTTCSPFLQFHICSWENVSSIARLNRLNRSPAIRKLNLWEVAGWGSTISMWLRAASGCGVRVAQESISTKSGLN